MGEGGGGGGGSTAELCYRPKVHLRTAVPRTVRGPCRKINKL